MRLGFVTPDHVRAAAALQMRIGDPETFFVVANPCDIFYSNGAWNGFRCPTLGSVHFGLVGGVQMGPSQQRFMTADETRLSILFRDAADLHLQ
ncbi:MAG: hypothetical protein WBF73_32615, partial [Bradyrhizobium sp.]